MASSGFTRRVLNEVLSLNAQELPEMRQSLRINHPQ